MCTFFLHLFIITRYNSTICKVTQEVIKYYQYLLIIFRRFHASRSQLFSFHFNLSIFPLKSFKIEIKISYDNLTIRDALLLYIFF